MVTPKTWWLSTSLTVWFPMEIGGHFKGKFCLFCLVVISINMLLSGWRDIWLSSAHLNKLLTLSCSDSDSFLRLELLLWIAVSSAKRSKARDGEKAMSLAFVSLDFQHAGVRRRVQCTRRSVDMQQFREVSRTRTIYSTETHTSDFILNMFWNGKPVQFFQERCWVVVTGCQENKSCSKVLNFLQRLDDRIRCTHEETVAVVKSWEDIGSNKSLGCIFSEKPVDWTNVFKLKISNLADFYDVLLHGQFWVKNESKVPGRIREGHVVRAKSNQVREGGRRFQGRWKGKEKSLFCHCSVWADFLSSIFLCCLCMHWVFWWGWSLHLEEQISGAVCHLRKADGLQSG